MKRIFWMFAVAVIVISLACGAAYAEPAIQIKGYEVIPEGIYPGTTGQLSLTLSNSGTDLASGTTIYYDYTGEERWSIYMGDLGPGSEAMTTVPFIVPEKLDTGILVLKLDVYYRDADGTNLKHSVSSIPITISQHPSLEADTVSLSKDTMHRGDKVTVELELRNTGGVVKNVMVSTPDDSSFGLDGTTSQWVGDIAGNSSTHVSVTVASSSDAAEGRYTIPLTITYNDALQNEITQTVNIGPVTITDSSSLFRMTCEAVSGSEIGSELAYRITLENSGNSMQSAVLVIEDNDVFTPIGTNTVYFDDIAPGESRSETVYLGVDASSASGYYTLPMTLSTNGEELEYGSGIYVQATPDIILTSETESADGGFQTTIKIANSGNTAIRSLYVYAEPTESIGISGTAEKFIGTLNVDDFASFQVTTVPKGQSESFSIPVTIQFRDNNNFEHTVKEEVEVKLGASAAMAGANATGTGFSGRPAGGPNGGLQIPSVVLYLGGGLVLLAVGYFGYRRWRGSG